MLPGIIPQHNLANFPFGNDAYTKLLLHCDGANNSTVFSDSSPLARGPATVVSGAKVSTAQSKFGGAAGVFNGSTDYLTYPDHADFNFGTGDWTIDFWFKRLATGVQHAFFGKNNSSLSNGYHLYVNTTGTVQCGWLPSDAAYNSFPTAAVANDTNWHHCVWQRRGTALELYVDGTLGAAGTISAGASITTNTNVFTIGKLGDFGLFGNIYIDEFRVTKGIARYAGNFNPPAAPYSGMPVAATGGNDSFTKLLLHCEGTNASTIVTDSSLAAHGNGSCFGQAQISSPNGKFGTGALSFPGNNYVTFPHSADWEFSTGDFTVDWWEYRIAGGSGGNSSFAREVASALPPWIFGYSSAGNRQIYISSDGVNWNIATGATCHFGSYSNGVWDHLAIVRNGTTFRAFKNGVQQTTWTSAAAIFANANPLSIGASQNGNNFAGYMDEIRISKGIARWTANFTPPTAPYS